MPETEALSVYQQAVADVADLDARIKFVEASAAAEILSMSDLRRYRQGIIHSIEAGVDGDDVVVARRYLQITWRRAKGPSDTWSGPWTGPRRQTPEVADQLARLRDMLRSGDLSFFEREYLGIKQYEQFSSQIENHYHGQGPRHGDIWWRAQVVDASAMTEADRLACIRFVNALIENPEVLP